MVDANFYQLKARCGRNSQAPLKLAPCILAVVLEKLAAGAAPPVLQDAAALERRIRAYDPWPATFTVGCGSRALRLGSARLESGCRGSDRSRACVVHGLESSDPAGADVGTLVEESE